MPNIMRAPLWHSMAESAGLTKPDGSIGETIYGQMTKFAAEVGAVNLGQGAPGTEPPEELITTTTEAMRDGFNQYAPGQDSPGCSRQWPLSAVVTSISTSPRTRCSTRRAPRKD